VLGLIFLRYADLRFAAVHEELEGKGSGRRRIGPADYHARGVLYLPEQARFDHVLNLPEGADLGKAVNKAMAAIEDTNPDLGGVLPRDYSSLPNDVMVELLRLLGRLPESIEGDGFGLIYEYFLGQFAFSEGQKGGEFFTPTSIVKLIVELIEPYHGRIYDPACGSGGMFVQSAHFVERHRKDPGSELSAYGQEKTKETVRLAKMNLAVHGLAGDIREANTYYEDLHDSIGSFDFVMANPPFNVNKVDKAKLEDDPRFSFGFPKPDNANYLWIQTFYSALNEHGRAGFVMANSASDARGSEMEIRRQLIEDRCVDVIVAVAPNFFFTVTLPVTLWFLDRGSAAPTARIRCCSSTPGTSTARSTGPTVTGLPSRSSSSPTSFASGETRSRSSPREAMSCCSSTFPTSHTSTWQACAESPALMPLATKDGA
jgi:type I restriction enzyme M protein